MKDYFLERMTKEELELYQKFPHFLSKEDFDKRSAIINRETKIDYKWGFFDSGPLAFLKRKFYIFFVHRFMKKSDG